MRRITSLLALIVFSTVAINAKTLIVYYSFTNNIHTIATDLQTQTGADILRIEPAEKGLDYAANNYAIGSAQIQAIRDNPTSASSYPAIDAVSINLADYDTFIIGTPLWWSNMAAPMQSFLFQYGSQMAGKNIGLVVSSASSGISSVVADAKRLIPNGNFLEPNLWIRSSQTSNCHSLISTWLTNIDYNNLTSAIPTIKGDGEEDNVVYYDLSGRRMTQRPLTGIYIAKGKSTTKKLLAK